MSGDANGGGMIWKKKKKKNRLLNKAAAGACWCHNSQNKDVFPETPADTSCKIHFILSQDAFILKPVNYSSPSLGWKPESCQSHGAGRLPRRDQLI